MLQVLLLDLDGTLTNPQAGIVGSIRHALEALEHPAPPESELASCIGPPLVESFGAILGCRHDDPLVRRALGHFRERFDARGWSENEVYPDVPEFLNNARVAGYRLFIATSKPSVFAKRIAEHFGFAKALDGIYGAELDAKVTNKADVIAALLKGEGLAREHAIMIGDRCHDVEGARAHDIPTLGVTYGFGSQQELEEAGAAWICHAPAEILDTLERPRR